MSGILILTQFYGKTLTDINAYGRDQFDFSRNLLGADFSVGEFGYTVWSFGDASIYLSVDGLSTAVPPRNHITELDIHPTVRDCFVGAVLEYIEYDGDGYRIQFAGFDPLYGYYHPNDGHTNRSYFDLDFPF